MPPQSWKRTAVLSPVAYCGGRPAVFLVSVILVRPPTAPNAKPLLPVDNTFFSNKSVPVSYAINSRSAVPAIADSVSAAVEASIAP